MNSDSRLIKYIFTFAIVISSITFILFYNFQYNRYVNALLDRHLSIAQIVIFSKINNIDIYEVQKRIEPLNAEVVTYNESSHILDKENLFKVVSYPKIKFYIYKHYGHYHTHIKYQAHIKNIPRDMVIIDRGFGEFGTYKYILFFIIAISLCIIIYYTLIKKSIAIQKARDMFVANIMHELKTPITKGKLITNVIDDKKNKERLDRVFIRMETLVNEFAHIEELISDQKIDKKEYRLSDLVDNAIDLMLDDYVIIQSYDDKKVVANYNLLSIAIKNILDNGVKYATDKKVEIISTDESIVCFKTKGERLKHKLSYYTEPFNKSDSTSFGLGLYIVKYILDYHNISLEYRHISGYNYFYFS